MGETRRERDYYPIVKEKLEGILRARFDSFYLQITANREFSNTFKANIGQYREIVFYFLREAAPDIAGFIKKEHSTDFLIVEFKREKIKLDDIYQTKKYAELLDARYALLISIEEIPEEIKRVSKVVYPLLSLPVYKRLTIVHYDEQTEQFVEWFEKNPFEEE